MHHAQQIQLCQIVKDKLDVVWTSGSPATYIIFSGFNQFIDPTVSDRTFLSVQDSMPECPKSVRTLLLKSTAVVAVRYFKETSFKSWCSRPQIKLSLLLFPFLIIGIPINFTFQTLSSHSISKNQMLSQWMGTKVHTFGFNLQMNSRRCIVWMLGLIHWTASWLHT